MFNKYKDDELLRKRKILNNVVVPSYLLTIVALVSIGTIFMNTDEIKY